MRISKRCKQALACDNNYIQNPRSAWFPSQCSDKHGSVCRCCCDFDNCNTRTINCETQAGPSCTRPDVPVNGAMSCPGNATVAPGGVCSFTCNAGFNLTGSAVISCNLINQTLAAFDQPPPTCAPMRDTPVCQPRQSAPQNGAVSCTNTNKVGSICTFSCGAGYYLTDGRNVLICGE
uniref:Sushi domain-containing protein n=1 Tax=Ciona savignyi TaxID=51511 RepID=H2YY53_CIOSA